MFLPRPLCSAALVVPAALLLLTSAGCAERGNPVAPSLSPGPLVPAELIAGGQNVNVKITTSNVNYDAGLGRLTFDLTVRNLTPQPLGTTDGMTLDPAGVRVFIVEGTPVVTAGTGTVTVPAPDGVGTFTAANQPYYQYNEVLEQYEVSPAKQWRLDMPPTVQFFTFTLLVSAAVQHPDGWVEIQPSTHSMPALQERTLSARVRNAVGKVDSTGTLSVNWSTGDANVATVTPVGYQSLGTVYTATLTGVQAGSTAITASVSSDTRTGGMTSNIGGIQRIWLGTAGTDNNLPGNWRHGRVPNASDTVVVHGDSATQMPVMAQNHTVGGVIMQPGNTTPFIDIGSFDLTLTSSIDQGPTGLILGTTGRMIFTGTNKTIGGGLTNVDYRNARVTGTYSLDTNLNVTGGTLVIEGGQLNNTSFRIRVRP